jgi:septal ring factor EnvC (AmiA/AmiB activator)
MDTEGSEVDSAWISVAAVLIAAATFVLNLTSTRRTQMRDSLDECQQQLKDARDKVRQLEWEVERLTKRIVHLRNGDSYPRDHREHQS